MVYNKLKIISMNFIGLGNSQKIKDVLNYLNGKHANKSLSKFKSSKSYRHACYKSIFVENRLGLC